MTIRRCLISLAPHPTGPEGTETPWGRDPGHAFFFKLDDTYPVRLRLIENVFMCRQVPNSAKRTWGFPGSQFAEQLVDSRDNVFVWLGEVPAPAEFALHNDRFPNAVTVTEDGCVWWRTRAEWLRARGC